MKKPQILAACPLFAFPVLERVLSPHADLVHVTTLAQADGALARRSAFALVVCGVYFDGSRMYELLELARARNPELPFLCVRVLDSELPRISLKAIEIAARLLGAAAFFDLPALARRDGAQAAEDALGQLVRRYLGAAAPQATRG